MPIREKLAAVAKAKKIKAGSTHGGNGGNVDIEEQSIDDLENNMDVDTLTDPEDVEGGSTHFSITAKKKIKADPTCEQNVGTLPNDTEPAQGYIENASEGDADFDEQMDLNEDEVEASLDEELENNNADTPLTAAEGEDEDWDSPPPDADAMDDDVESEEEGGEDTAEFVAPEEATADADEMSIMDVDEMDDADNKDIHFATAGTRVLVIKANRIIASMTEGIATKAGRIDVYLTDQYQEVTASEIAKRGLRRGLKAMGFVEARVKIQKNSVIAALVKKEVTKTTAAVRQVANVKQEALEQSLAIASVGINRGFFQKNENVLRAALEEQLIQAGVRNPKRMLTQVFASVGPEYAKQVMQLAQKIAAMPQEARDGYVEALDMTSEDLDEPDEDMIPIGAGDDDEEEDFNDVEELSPTMATAGVVMKRRNKVTAGTYSLQASAVLNGDVPLFSL
jgi:hypothetical protein